MADIKTDDHIGRAALLKRIEASPLVKNYLMLRGSQTLINGILDIIKRQPAADVVEVVRCKNCKYFDIEEDDALGMCVGKFICVSSGGEIYPKPNHFCSYGERKVDDA